MGKINEGFTGGFSGKVGNAVGYHWRGQWCIRIRPASYHDAKSDGQLQQRSRFKQMVSFAGHAKQILQIGLHKASMEQGMTECNYFMKLNNKHFSLQEGQLAIDYEQLVFSEGPVAPVAFNSVEMVGETTLRIGFEKNPLHRTARSNDEVYVVLYFPEVGQFQLSKPAYRKDKQLDIELSETQIGQVMHLWGFVQDYAGRSSETQYIGNGEPLEEAEDEDTLFDMQTSISQRYDTPTSHPQTTDGMSAAGAADGLSAHRRERPPE